MGKEHWMKKFLYFFLTSLCLLLLTSVAFASITIYQDDGIRGAPLQQDQEGLYAATNDIAVAILTKTAPLATWMVRATPTFIDADKGAVADASNSAVAVRSEVLAPAIKDFFASISTFGRTSPVEKPVKEGVMPLAVGKVFSSNSIFFKIILAAKAPTARNSEVMPLAIKPTASIIFA